MDRLQGWMSAPRKEFGPNGWERLLAGAEINCHRTEGDHFSMMNPPLVEQTGQLIAQVLEALLAPDGRLSC
jgi:iron transport multicopper oxidase